MATDYDAPRNNTDDTDDDSIEELKSRRSAKSAGTVDIDEPETAEGIELPGAEISDEELSVRVLPMQQDEFTRVNCFMVHHRSQLARQDRKGRPVCRECASAS
ncbi:DUF4193 domain-containing protein [Kitasatospora sp. MAP5-34]|uniref:DUF4193 domain-containing protein n=1 Tax=Kitasatospora sp. MAP5-34 TaxID=3035102 RepID=UPI00247339A9|nr:DUF4193 domain-containing protein [Kitasatospora sp. MAP5-34]